MPNISLETLGLTLIPEPQQIEPLDGTFRLNGAVSIVCESDDGEDRFAAEYLAESLVANLGVDAKVVDAAPGGSTSITLARREGSALKPEGYRLQVTGEGITIEGNDTAGVYWGTQTLRQVLSSSPDSTPCINIEDWPDVTHRSMHYDTKHHQDKKVYVEGFIRMLASYKVNMLVWEWEDKLAYERHPEIGAPGAFTKAEMQAFTYLARRHHIQLVPLVQGLGHVSYILKHLQHRHLREVENSNYEFCALNDDAYALLFDLWDEAMEATPGSDYLHIGSDETRELGVGVECGCKAKADEIGKDGLMHLFIERSGKHVESRGRQAMCWYWGYRPDAQRQAPERVLYVDNRETPLVKATQDHGYDVFSYAPNPGIEPLFICYFPWVKSSMWHPGVGRTDPGSFALSGETVAETTQAGITKGTMTTSWDDSGHHNQAWVPRFICTAEYAWSSKGPDTETWIDRFFLNYFGPNARFQRELYKLMQDAVLFYYDTLERRVWHWGDIGKIHIPDFPRQQLEYHPFWYSRYSHMLNAAAVEKQVVTRARWIIEDNLSRDIRNRYDFELYGTIIELCRHNVDLILMLGDMETAIGSASKLHFSNREESLRLLESVQAMIETHLADRAQVYDGLVSKWEETRLPKGLSTPDKDFLWATDRSHHLANRTADMRYLIMDEELLGLEEYLEKLKPYIAEYKQHMDS